MNDHQEFETNALGSEINGLKADKNINERQLLTQQNDFATMLKNGLGEQIKNGITDIKEYEEKVANECKFKKALRKLAYMFR